MAPDERHDITDLLPVLKKHLLHKEPMLERIVYEGTPEQQQRLRERIEAFPIDVCVYFKWPPENSLVDPQQKYFRVYEDSDGAVTIAPLRDGLSAGAMRTREEGLLLPNVEPELLYRGVLYRIHEKPRT
jgi:hypothetical protein